MLKRVKLDILTLVFLFLVMQQAILYWTPWRVLTYVDEILVCLFVVAIFVKMIKDKVYLMINERVMIVMFVVFLLCGLISTFLNGFQSLGLSLGDAFVCCKFVVFYLAGRILLTREDTVGLLKRIVICCRVIAVVLFVLAIHEIVMEPFFEKCDFRYVMYSLKLFFPHPTYTSFACFTCALPLMLCQGVEDAKGLIGKKRDYIYIALLFFVMLTTFRTKAIAAAACSVLVFGWYVLLKRRSAAPVIGGGVVLAGALGWKSLQEYYFGAVRTFNVRSILMRDCVGLANRFFPFGTGFGTYGSAVAADHYSPIYYTLGYQYVWGMMYEHPDYLCDTFWPIVVAQTGWVGLIAFVVIVFCFILISFKAVHINKFAGWMLLSVMIYELISSIAETAFFNPASCVMFAVFALGVNVCIKGTDHE